MVDENYIPEALKVMVCIKKFHLTLRQWHSLSREEQLTYLYGMTGISIMEQREQERAKKESEKRRQM
jgi:hypothetical protein